MAKSLAQTQAQLQALIQNMLTQTAEVFKDDSDDEIQSMTPEYINPAFEAKISFPKIYRFNQKGMRYYYTVDGIPQLIEKPMESGEKFTNASGLVTFYPSVTTIIDKTMPTPYSIKKLIADLGMKGYYKMLREKASYGTLLHTLISDYLRSGNTKKERSFDFDTIKKRIELYTEEQKLDFDTAGWEWQIKKDLASLIQFIWDYNVDPISIEAVGFYKKDEHKYAGAVDLICEMDIEEKGFFGEVYKSGEKKGQPKETKQIRRTTAIVDFKSGKSGFFETHEIQLHMYKQMIQESLGIEAEKVFNVAPKDWHSAPTYSLKDQTDSTAAKKIPYLLNLFNLEWEEPKDFMRMSGKVNGTGAMDNLLKRQPAADYILNKMEQKEFFKNIGA